MALWKIVLVGLLAAWLSFVAGIFYLMTRPPARFAAAMARMPGPLFLVFPFETLWSRARAGALQPGDEAPDFQLPSLDTHTPISLASFRGSKPVVLIFGSYT